MKKNVVDWIEIREAGLFCKPGNFYIDPKLKVETAVVSHAHGDHFRPGLTQTHAHPYTLAIGGVRHRNNQTTQPLPLNYHEKRAINGVEITLLPAGHIPGSAQILISYNNQNVLYSGDFTLQDPLFFEPIEYPQHKIDLLISESTFGEKEHHPDPFDEIRLKIGTENNSAVMFGCYKTGKAQRLTQLLSRIYPERPIYIHPKIMGFHRAYERLGLDIGTFHPYKKRLAQKQKSFFYLVPPRILSQHEKDFRFRKFFATGWNNRKKEPFLEDFLEISDHADYTQIMSYIEKINPKEVWFFHGYSEKLRKACKVLDIPANHINL